MATPKRKSWFRFCWKIVLYPIYPSSSLVIETRHWGLNCLVGVFSCNFPQMGLQLFCFGILKFYLKVVSATKLLQCGTNYVYKQGVNDGRAFMIIIPCYVMLNLSSHQSQIRGILSLLFTIISCITLTNDQIVEVIHF